jgi:hypothetical protein
VRKRLIIAATFALAPSAFAQGRPSTTTMTCRAAGALVAQQGAIVLSTGPQTYDRYVRSGNFCPTGLFPRPAFVATRDNPQCDIGFYCTGMRPDRF